MEIVERQVQVTVSASPSRRDWLGVLRELRRQLDDGRLRDRDLSGLGAALEVVLAAYH